MTTKQFRYPKLPVSIKERISNANYYLDAASRIPLRGFEAIRISLLLTAWENVQIAEEELHSWAQQTPPAQKLYTSHAYKFRNIRKSKSIDRIVINSRGKAETTSYVTASDFERLLQICRYGFKNGTRDLAVVFKSGWFFEDFERALVSKIRWEETSVKMYEEIIISEKTT